MTSRRSPRTHALTAPLRRTSGAALSLLTLVGAAGLVLLPADTAPAPTRDRLARVAASTPAVSCSGGICTQTFTSNGSWSQPSAVGDVRIVAAGGSGGYSGDGTEGGEGRVLTVDSPSKSFSFSIGGEGADGDGTNGGRGGAHGGGDGGDAVDGADGGGGGGATFLVDEQTGAQVLVAAGGGGAGGGFENGDKGNGYQPRFFGEGGDGGLDGAGHNGVIGQFQANASCPSNASTGGVGVSPNAGDGGGGGNGGQGVTDSDVYLPGYGGGSGGGGGGERGPGRGGCGSQSASGNGADGGPGQGGLGGGNGRQGNCTAFGCLTGQSKNGGGGGGGGIVGGGGGGAARGLAAGGGGGGGSLLTEGVKDAGLQRGPGYLTIHWRLASPRVSILGATSDPASLASTGPGHLVSIPIDVQNRQPGSGSAGKVYVTDEIGGTGTVRLCAGSTNARNVPNGDGVVYCQVTPTEDSRYMVFYEPSAQYGGSRQQIFVNVTVGTEQSTTTMATPAAVVAGDSVQLKATVSAVLQQPTGSVDFEYHDRSTGQWRSLGSANAVVRSDGRTADATLTARGFPAAADQVRATYGGNSTVGASSTGPVNLRVNNPRISLGVSSTVLTYGDRLTLTATAPECTSGRVDFYDADTTGRTPGTLLGSAAIGTDHVAQLTMTPSVGDLVLSARGSTGTTCAGSDRGIFTDWQLVSTVAAPTVLTIDSADVRDDYAEVSGQVTTPTRNSIPSGRVTVEWRNDAGQRRTAGADLSSGRFAVTAADLKVGASQIQVTYAGSSSYVGATTSVPVSVEQRRTTVTLSGVPASVRTAGTIPVTATVSSGGQTLYDGSVRVAGVDADLTDGAAVVDVPVTELPGTTKRLRVEYLGTEVYAASSASSTVAVTAVPVTLTPRLLGTDDGSVQLGVTAGVAAPGSTLLPDGDVAIREKGTTAWTPVTMRSTAPEDRACLTCAEREGIVSLPQPAAGPRTYEVSYTDASTRTTSAPAELTIDLGARRPITFPGPYTWGATPGDTVHLRTLVLDGDDVVQTGTVKVYDGDQLLGSGRSGSSMSFVPTWTGTRTLRATYSGDATHQSGATAGYATVTVRPAPLRSTDVVPAQRTYSVEAGDVLTVPVTVNEVAGGTVTGGELTLSDNRSGTLLATATAGPGAELVVTPDWSGTRELVVHYLGSSTHASSAAIVRVTVTEPEVEPPAATSVASERASYSVARGGEATIPVVVTSGGSAVSGGRVELYDGSRRLARTTAGPGAAFVLTPDWTGRRDLRIAYLGTTAYAASEGTVALDVTTPAAPTLTGVRPGSLPRGSTQVVTVSGTGFTDRTRLVAPGAGVRVVGEPTLVSGRRLTARVQVGPSAALGSRTWSISDGAGTIACATAGACDVTVVSSPRISSLSTSVLRRGRSTTVTVNGGDLLEGLQAAVTGTGVQVRSVQVRSATRAVVELVTAASAPTGRRGLRLTNTDGGVVTLDGALRVVR